MSYPISYLTGRPFVPSTYVVVPKDYTLHPSTAKAVGVVAETDLGEGEKILEIPPGKTLTPALQAAARRSCTLKEIHAEIAKVAPVDLEPEPVEEPKELDGKTLK